VGQSQIVSDVEKLAGSLGELPELVVKPVFVVVSGLPGTGKSYFCRRLAERLPSVILESDALRRVLFPLPSYSLPESAQLFKAIRLLIERLLGKGVSLILDATNLSERYREYLYSIADRLEVKLILVRVEAPLSVVKERLRARLKNPEEKSDADWEISENEALG
jgi:predicted kinase